MTAQRAARPMRRSARIGNFCGNPAAVCSGPGCRTGAAVRRQQFLKQGPIKKYISGSLCRWGQSPCAVCAYWPLLD